MFYDNLCNWVPSNRSSQIGGVITPIHKSGQIECYIPVNKTKRSKSVCRSKEIIVVKSWVVYTYMTNFYKSTIDYFHEPRGNSVVKWIDG